MADVLPRYIAAAVQAAPVPLDRDATVEKACALISDAAKGGAKLIVFPETWIPTYPWWHTSPNVFSADLFARLWKNSVEVPSDATRRLSKAAAKAGAYVVIGINERDLATRGTLFNTLLHIAPDGQTIHKHRKLMPTFTERTIWGMGDGSDLQVHDTPLGRMGGLICWEHQVTLAKFAQYAQGEQVHCAIWPAYTSQNAHIDFGMRQYAFEGACFVVSACGIVPEGSLPEDIVDRPIRANGGSAIIGPNGDYLAGPVYDKEEILYAEIDLEVAIREKHSRDVGGHYARPDVFQLTIKSQPNASLTFAAQLPDTRGPVSLNGKSDVDRLQAVRAYLDSLAQRTNDDGDSSVHEALAEALASIDMAAAGLWSRE